MLPPGAPPDSGDGSQPCPCVCWLVVAITLMAESDRLRVTQTLQSVDVHAAQMPQEARVKVWGQVLACEKTGHMCLIRVGPPCQVNRKKEEKGKETGAGEATAAPWGAGRPQLASSHRSLQDRKSVV